MNVLTIQTTVANILGQTITSDGAVLMIFSGLSTAAADLIMGGCSAYVIGVATPLKCNLYSEALNSGNV